MPSSARSRQRAPFLWRLAGEPMMARFKCYLDSLSPQKKKALSEFGKTFWIRAWWLIWMMRMWARGLYMKIDNLLKVYSISFVAVSARDLGNLHGKMMSYQEGKIDSPFCLRCEFQILVQCRSRFYVFYKDINY